MVFHKKSKKDAPSDAKKAGAVALKRQKRATPEGVGVCDAAITRMMRQGGVITAQHAAREVVRADIKKKLRQILRNSLILCKMEKKSTIGSKHIREGVKQATGHTIFGGDE